MTVQPTSANEPAQTKDPTSQGNSSEERSIASVHLPEPIAPQQFDPVWAPHTRRYEAPGAVYRRCGRSGLDLPTISLGLWHNFGDDHSIADQRKILRAAFDMGITHFDLANNYGVPYGSAESNFGHHMDHDFRPYRDELVISTKAGYDMWPGPYGAGGSGRKYMLASLDQSLTRMRVDYVDIFYSHRHDATTPLEETIGALEQAVRSGKALYAGISSYDPAQTRHAVELAREVHLPLVVHQPRYSLLDRRIEAGLSATCDELGLGIAVFSPLAQGLLTSKYLGTDSIPQGSRMREQRYLTTDVLTKPRLDALRSLSQLAAQRGQSLAQMALAWILRDRRITTVLVGASSVAQLRDNVAALNNLHFDQEELEAIDHATQAALLV
ncbi:L-glyceraldehyde 3-phosphate reductase [Schaalia suimastitidis]|uniref:L-glyceraldehyde 3-phosphate reductase n=1 Tax=Schaalia suimastitidis TaxID=121163 RepID=UPI000424E188|nr:L-glyceraldehyde 3-phosphate reductase [Schaalia suimastitidis]